MAGVKESQFQRSLIKEIRDLLKDAIIMKLDSSYIQGIPDLLILYGEKWATLECKKSQNASHRPNQNWYVDRMNSMSFSRFVFPENKDEVIDGLIDFFKVERKADTNEIQQSL